MTSQEQVHSPIISMHPLYSQLKEQIRSSILDGTYAPNTQMPSESEMMRAFNVSRSTVRLALRCLQSEGLIFKVPGKGSFVSRPKATQELISLQGFGEAMITNGHETFSTLLGYSERVDNKLASSKLRIGCSDIMEIRRLRYLDRVPISVDITYVPSSIGRRLILEDLATEDIFVIVENKYAIKLGHAEVQLEAVLSDDALSSLLKIEEGSPILRMERLTYSADGSPIDYEHLYYRGDMLKYKTGLKRN
ncbi:GntR family transcriptional regulator [Acidithiobacillus sp.]|uniref:GntR family transcriptional regulator n=1 Tax=Acidithiobacillus sp. TaxID=1872118 RepID=UPI002615FCDE|nr:GntR family transcriptional regulator [Acidithiobacillus sp.]